MQVPAAIFREYDIRGTVGDQLTVDVARAVGQGVATLAWSRLARAPRLTVGRDNRPSGAALAAGVGEGIVAAGGHALDIGECPTPALY
ncbi:MAG: phosphomannomutase/phosphoglucomutase, partial [Gemmatimonadales bacterium]